MRTEGEGLSWLPEEWAWLPALCSQGFLPTAGVTA